MTTRTIYWAVVLMTGVLMFLGNPIHAETPLTSNQVGRFVQSIYKIHEIAKKYGPSPVGASNLQGSGTGSSAQGSMSGSQGMETMERAKAPISSAMSQLQGHQAYNEILGVIRSYGFADEKEWAMVGDRAMRAYAAVRIEKENPEIDAQMQDAIRQIENSNMSEEQKQQMLQMMQGYTQAISDYSGEVSEADKDAVMPHIAAIDGWEELQ